jgi:hypothetical protein
VVSTERAVRGTLQHCSQGTGHLQSLVSSTLSLSAVVTVEAALLHLHAAQQQQQLLLPQHISPQYGINTSILNAASAFASCYSCNNVYSLLLVWHCMLPGDMCCTLPW